MTEQYKSDSREYNIFITEEGNGIESVKVTDSYGDIVATGVIDHEFNEVIAHQGSTEAKVIYNLRLTAFELGSWLVGETWI